ncbi:MAG: ABC transporter permease [Deltaproteobacteria bacterium]|nr:ABC transporter permease [Deltaproteobacteria bacterium]
MTAADPQVEPQPDPADAVVDWARHKVLGPVRAVEALGDVLLFTLTAVWRARKPPLRWAVYLQQMEFVGVGSLGIILLTGAFTGAVFAIQTSVAFSIFKAKSLIGGSVALALVLELAPTMGALMVAGRVGSAMTTELGTMRVTEQIDALETMAVDPLHYLVAPRVVACTLMMPLLTMSFNAIGMLGSYIVCRTLLGVDHASFFSRIYEWVDPADIACSVVKGTAFGAIIGAIAAYKGFWATGGSRGVGLATTSTVVTASVAVLVMDYVITSVWMVLFPAGG